MRMPATKTAKKKPVTKKRNIAKRPAAKRSTTRKSKSMSMPEIKKKALYLGITPGKMKKAELIHSIQMTEGNQPCYGTSGGYCEYTECCFYTDCLKS
jgi:hypothetical protein